MAEARAQNNCVVAVVCASDGLRSNLLHQVTSVSSLYFTELALHQIIHNLLLLAPSHFLLSLGYQINLFSAVSEMMKLNDRHTSLHTN